MATLNYRVSTDAVLNVAPAKLVWATIRVLVNEVNVVRAKANLPALTAADIIPKLKAALRQ